MIVWERVNFCVKHQLAIRFHQNFTEIYLPWLSSETKEFDSVKTMVAPPGWLSGERVRLMTWWLRVRSPVEATFLSGVFSPLTSAEACEKSSRWLWKEKLC